MEESTLEHWKGFSSRWNWNGKVALITGIGGQDGSYLAEFLLKKGYKVRGIVRRSSFPNTSRIDHLMDLEEEDNDIFHLTYADLSDASSLRRVLHQYMPDEVYNLAAQSHVGLSFMNAESTINFNLLGPLKLLEAIKEIKPDCRYYQASSSEMFGISPPPQSEDTPMMPCSPYGISKLGAFHLTRVYREGYGIFACNGILFNHESPRRGWNFVTKKITREIAEILKGRRNSITMGNLKAKRDWGFSKEYVEAMWEIMQQEKPDDFVIATEETHTIEEFLEEAFNILGLNWREFVNISDRYKRPFDVPALLGDPSKALKTLTWRPKTKFKDLVKMMLAEDLRSSMNWEGSDEEVISKAREFVPEMIRRSQKEKTKNLFSKLNELEGSFPKEIIENIRESITKGLDNEN